MSAGVVHTVARNCSRGDIDGCGCFRQSNGAEELDHYSQHVGDENESADWSWGGCSDNIEFGQVIAKRVLDKPEEQGTDLQAHAHLQNNLVGRTVSYGLRFVLKPNKWKEPKSQQMMVQFVLRIIHPSYLQMEGARTGTGQQLLQLSFVFHVIFLVETTLVIRITSWRTCFQ